MTNRLIARQVTPEQQALIRERILTRVKPNHNGCWITQPSQTGEPKSGRPSMMKLFGWCLTAPVWSVLGWKTDILPAGTAICHTCDIPRCANPDHLWIGNDSENARDAYQKRRRRSPFINGRPPRSRKMELMLGRRRILKRWYGDKWKEEYEKRYGHSA